MLAYNNAKKTNFSKSDFDWSQSRIIFICREFSEKQKMATDFKDLSIELWEVRRYANDTLMFSPIGKSKHAVSISPLMKSSNNVIEDLKKLKTVLEERMLGQCQGKQVRLRDILIERVEKSRINNQYEVLSSTVSGIYSQREYFNKEIASADNTGYKAIHRGDVVLSPQNLWMGNINYNDRFEIGIVSPSYKVFSIDEKFDKGYIAFLLKTRKALWAYSLVSEQGASIVRRNLNYESFLEISFVIPSLKEQQATARRLSAFKQKQTMEEAFLRSLLLQKEFMLKSLFI